MTLPLNTAARTSFTSLGLAGLGKITLALTIDMGLVSKRFFGRQLHCVLQAVVSLPRTVI